jgi:hypothetical protein
MSISIVLEATILLYRIYVALIDSISIKFAVQWKFVH